MKLSKNLSNLRGYDRPSEEYKDTEIFEYIINLKRVRSFTCVSVNQLKLKLMKPSDLNGVPAAYWSYHSAHRKKTLFLIQVQRHTAMEAHQIQPVNVISYKSYSSVHLWSERWHIKWHARNVK